MRCVIVVDDRADVSRMLAKLIQRSGYRSVWLTSGAEALAYLREHEADLVILDVMMPDMDGLEVLRRIREELKLDELRVVMFSALADAEVQRTARRLGAREYWVKGLIDFGKLSRRLEAVLPGE